MKRKHTSDNLLPIIHANWGLPKWERPSLGLCVMPTGDKSQARDSKRDDTEYPTWQRSFHSSPRTLNRQGML